MSSPEIQGAYDACCECKEPEKKVCYVLEMLKNLGVNYKGFCGRTTENGVILTKGDVNEEGCEDEKPSKKAIHSDD